MQIDILTLFPKMFSGPFDESIIKRAKEKGLIRIDLHNLRDWAIDERGSVDDRPYGGGAGMVIRVDVMAKALQKITNYQLPITNKILNLKSQNPNKSQISKSKKQRIILLTPQGRVFDQEKARELSKLDRVILICGHYEGFDERIREHLVDEQLSIGEYVLTGGELAAMVVTDAVTRLIPGVLLKQEATQLESFSDLNSLSKNYQLPITNYQTNSNNQILNNKKMIEYPQYTRPEEFNGWKVPEILLSGDHKKIEEWKMNKLRVKNCIGMIK